MTEVARAFWQGLTRPHGGVATSAIALFAAATILYFCIAKEDRVRTTPADWWISTEKDDYGRLNALVIQGAGRHTDAKATNVVFVGSSTLRAFLPNEADTTKIFAAESGEPVNSVSLCCSALGFESMAGTLDRFGTDFKGWVVLGVNRHTLASDTRLGRPRRVHSQALLAFDSPVLRQELEIAGWPPRSVSGIPAWDFPLFYMRTLAGYRHLFLDPPTYNPHPVQGKLPPPTMDLSPRDPLALDRHMGLLRRIAERLRAQNGPRLALVELPMLDEFRPDLQTPAWRKQRAEDLRLRKQWSEKNQVLWIDLAAASGVRAEDFYDDRHNGNDEVRRRMAELLAAELTRLSH